jgi:hypothetical protein
LHSGSIGPILVSDGDGVNPENRTSVSSLERRGSGKEKKNKPTLSHKKQRRKTGTLGKGTRRKDIFELELELGLHSSSEGLTAPPIKAVLWMTQM